MKLLNPDSTMDFVPLCDRDLPKEEQAVFELSFLTVDEEALITDKLGQVGADGDFKVNLGSQAVTALDLGLAGARVEGLSLKRDETSKYYPCTKKRKWDRKELSKIPPAVRQEVAREIMRQSNITEEEEKN